MQGVPTSWDPVIVAVKCSHNIRRAVWSPCSRFVAIDELEPATETQILDAITLKQVTSLAPREDCTQLLTFSTDSRLLTQLGGESEAFISWDLQTGVPVNIISKEQGEKERHHLGGSLYHQDRRKNLRKALSIAYSRCGTMFGVLFKHRSTTVIVTYNVLSGTSIGQHPVERPAADMIWADDKCIRFATFGLGSITIWEVGFVSEHPAAKIESLPIPKNFDPSTEFLFLPTLYRLAFVPEGSISVWDAQRSNLLLSSVDIEGPAEMTFSSDGRFFAYATNGPEIYLWKDSPTGYTLHYKLVTGIRGLFRPCRPLLSPDGRSILAFHDSTLRLWHTTDSATSLPNIPTPASWSTQPFVLGFSPDESLAATARLLDNTAVVLDVKSGVPRFAIDAGMKVYGPGVAGNTVVVVGEGRIVTWNLLSTPPQTSVIVFGQ